MSSILQSAGWKWTAAVVLSVIGWSLVGAEYAGVLSGSSVGYWIVYIGLLVIGLAGSELIRVRRERGPVDTEKIIDEVLSDE